MSLESWVDEERVRRASDQHARADAQKLVATFLSAADVTMTAAALQAGTTSVLDWLACFVTAVALGFALAVIVEDRLKDPDVSGTLNRALTLGRDQDQMLDDLRVAAATVIRFNEDELARLQRRLRVQVIAAAAATVLAAWSLLAGA